MKILHIGYSDKLGGASIAMMRLHQALKKTGIESKVLVGEKLSNDEDVIGPNSSIEKILNETKIILARQKKYIYNFDNKYSHSLNIFKSKILSKIKQIKPDIINLHWINNELMSIKEISKIDIPIVWTFNDMWPMCGGEHYSENNRYKFGYDNTKKEKNESGFDINRFLWSKKKKFWNTKINHVVCISNWLKRKVSESYLFRDHNISFIPCTIDKSEWKPISKIKAREILNLPQNKKILLFMSTNGDKDFRKGFTFIKSSLENLLTKREDITLIKIGKNNLINKNFNEININKSFNGEPLILRMYYSAADVLLTPSVLEAFGQVAVEAAACGTPSIGFKNTGLEDTILHKKTGYLSDYLDQNDFNKGLEWIINESPKNNEYFKNSCLDFISRNFSSEVVSEQYINIYKQILKNEISK